MVKFSQTEASYLLDRVSKMPRHNLENENKDSYKQFLDERYGGLPRGFSTIHDLHTLCDELNSYNENFREIRVSDSEGD